MDIHELMAGLPQPGAIVPVPVKGYGEINVLTLDAEEVLAIEGEHPGIQMVVKSIVDKAGRPAFKSVADMLQRKPRLPWRFVAALIAATQTVNAFDGDDIEKKSAAQTTSNSASPLPTTGE